MDKTKDLFRRSRNMLSHPPLWWKDNEASRERLIAELDAALAEPDLDRCPRCGGPADNGHDREVPPNPYYCTKCMAEPGQEPLTIERLRDALVASRIIPPAAVEDPDEYDDGVTLFRIEALHRRIT